MSLLGQFLELSVPSEDVPASLAFYRALGFTEVPVADIRPWFHAAVTDGQVIIGLHGGGLEQPALCFVRTELERHLPALTDAGLEPAFARLGEDQFHEAGAMAPDDLLLLLVEAPTVSTAMLDESPPTLIGRSSEISLRCRDPEEALAFWTRAGFLAVSGDEPDGMLVATDGLTLGLRGSVRSRDPVLRFEPRDVGAVMLALEASGVRRRRTAEGEIVLAPEGTALLLVC
jgi:catechol 2,3-dioxygenase-like lactoylglutathione lyase family enzyme